MPAVEQVRIILERTFGFPVLESDAQIVLDRLTELARKEAVEHHVHRTAIQPCGCYPEKMVLCPRHAAEPVENRRR